MTPPSFDLTVVATRYEAPVDQLVQSLKFHANLALAPVFARQLLHGLGVTTFHPSTLLLPVPLSDARLADRGFNQALEIARPVARALGISLAKDLCIRVKDTPPQAGLTAAQRQVNMRAAFALSQPRAVLGRPVIVVDDVMTTGHTLQSLAACLKRHGALSVLNLVFARTPQR